MATNKSNNNEMKTQNILITGANGQLGHEMRNVLAGNQRFNAIFTDVAGDDIVSLDITDEAGVEKMVTDGAIDFIVNCAVGTECLLSIILDWVIKRYRPIDIKCGVKGTMGIIQIEIPYGSACAGTSIPVVTRLIEKRVKTGQRIVCLELDVRKLDKHHQDVPGAVSQVLEN